MSRNRRSGRGAAKTAEKAVTEARDVEIRHEPVDLASLLKFGDVVSSGGEAKLLIQDGEVQVNGQTETRRRRKIMAGDIVLIGRHCLRVCLQSAPDEADLPETSP